MNIILSGDIRKDKRKNGYVLNNDHYPNIFRYSASTLTLTTWPQYYDIVLDSFDYSNNFIERKNGFYNRGTSGLGFGIDFNFNNIGYKHNLYLSGSTNFTGFSGFTITNNYFSYAEFNKQLFTINGLPDYSGLTINTATTLSGNVYIKLDIGEGVFINNIPFTANTYTIPSITLDNSNSYIDNTSISGLDPGTYEMVIDFGSTSCVDFKMYDGIDIFSPIIYEYICDGSFPYNLTTAFTFTLTSGNVTLYNSSLSDIVTINGITLNEIDYDTITTYELTGNTKNLIQYNIEGDNIFCELYKNNERVRTINEPNTYSDIIDFSGKTINDTWVNFFTQSTNEVRLNNIKLFPLT